MTRNNDISILRASHTLQVGNSNMIVQMQLSALPGNQARVQLQKSKFQKKFPAPAWRLKSKQNKKRIATAICKWRDESNEPN